jgi:hypothetical protein
MRKGFNIFPGAITRQHANTPTFQHSNNTDHMRIPTLLQKISVLLEQTERPGVIEVDLMLDYTRVMYADLLEWRAKLASAPAPAAAQPVSPPIPAAATRPIPTPAIPQPAKPPVTPPAPPPVMPPIHEPTLAELAAAMDKQLAEEEDAPIPAKPEAKAPPAHHIPRPTATKPPILPDSEAPPAKPAAAATPPPQVKPVVQADTTAVPSQTGMKPAGAVQQAQNSRDIRSLISINDKYQIMSDLVGNDKEAYEAALNHINNSGSEAAAIRWLQDTLWVTEERSDAVQNFYDLVNRFVRT